MCLIDNKWALVQGMAWGLFHYWESELTFGNLTNFWKLANKKVPQIANAYMRHSASMS